MIEWVNCLLPRPLQSSHCVSPDLSSWTSLRRLLPSPPGRGAPDVEPDFIGSSSVVRVAGSQTLGLPVSRPDGARGWSSEDDRRPVECEQWES